MNQQVEIQIEGGEPLVFHFRAADSPAAMALYDAVIPKIEHLSFASGASDEQQVHVARAFGAVLFPSEEATSEVMRTILRGPHDRIDWHRDGSWARMIAIAADWLTRARADLSRSVREEEARLVRIAQRSDEA